ncbi:MAG: hypothetical protein A2539_03885 [Elusimicrobia bacterium RIFOXYD2_FULL_34_15]|nr:MAG: hypothetical protein A2539_03885 [Elusimicrobia bacterium RIFOXYD2_FULL_34_15]
MKRKHLFTYPHIHLSTRSKGLTLVELMINIVSVSIIAMALTSLFLKFIQFWQLSSAKTDIQRDGRTAINAINKNLRQADASSIVVDRYDANQPPYSRISFTKNNQIYVYYQQDQTLYEVINSTISLAKSLRCISFTYPETSEDSIVNVSITFEKKTYNQNTKALQLSTAKVRIMN